MGTLRIFTIGVGLLTAAACAAPNLTTPPDTAEDPAPIATKVPKKPATPPAAPPPTPDSPPAPSPAQPPPDAGAIATPPSPTTRFCLDLTTCCATLTGANKTACVNVQIAGNEIACKGELALCGPGSGGPVGGAASCNDLDRCCDQIWRDGYRNDALDCWDRNMGNGAVCSSWLSEYRRAGWCF